MLYKTIYKYHILFKHINVKQNTYLGNRNIMFCELIEDTPDGLAVLVALLLLLALFDVTIVVE